MTPGDLADRARQLAGELPSLTATVERRAEIVARGMGAFAAVAAGSYQEPALITSATRGRPRTGPCSA